MLLTLALFLLILFLGSQTRPSHLGLTLARGMAQAHGGDVTYSPREGGGSCFTLSVPLSEVQ